MRRFSIIFITIFLFSCSPSGDSEGWEPGKGEIDEIPSAIVTIDGEKHALVHGGYYLDRGGSAEQTDAASPNQIAETFEPIKLKENPEIEVSVNGNPTISVYEWDPTELIEEIPLENNVLNVSEKNGEVIFELFCEWNNAEASYTFVVQVDL